MEINYDWIIKNGRIIDGTGTPWFKADLGIRAGKIATVGSLVGCSSIREVDAKDKIVCPGFIDAHSHSDSVILSDPINLPKLSQGITTEIIGQDGISFLPLSSRTSTLIDNLWHGINGHSPVDGQMKSLVDLFIRIDRNVVCNYAYLIPHSSIRMEVMGITQREASSVELSAMISTVRQLMEEGAIGLSTGLTYWPECFTPTNELIQLCRTVAQYGGIYVTHIRDYGEGIINAIEEAILIGNQAEIPVHISHLCSDDERIIHLIDNARLEGLNVTFDLYPYLAGNTLLVQFLPQFIYGDNIDETLINLKTIEVRKKIRDFVKKSNTDWNLITISNSFSKREIEGFTVSNASRRLNKDPVDLVCDLLIETKLAATVIEFENHCSEEGLTRLMNHPSQMFCSDGILIGAHLHPRTYGTFPRILGRYVRQNQVLKLEEAIRKMTSFPAQCHGIPDRGLLKEGMAADIVIFDPNQIIDRADFQVGNRFSLGINYVWVNGELVYELSQPTGNTPGRILTLQGFSNRNTC